MPFYNLSSSGGTTPGTVQAGIESLAAGATSQTVTFPTAYAAAPSVVANIFSPAGSALVGGAVTAVSATQFTFTTDAPTPTSSYKLVWHASLPS